MLIQRRPPLDWGVCGALTVWTLATFQNWFWGRVPFGDWNESTAYNIGAFVSALAAPAIIGLAIGSAYAAIFNLIARRRADHAL
jgi:hypothetical protein